MPAGGHLKDTAVHTKDAMGAKFEKNKAEAQEHLRSGPQAAEAAVEKDAAKHQEKASLAAAKGHADHVSLLCLHVCHK